jgi:hypothetical protein
MLSRRSVLVGVFASTMLAATIGAQSSKPCMIGGMVLDAASRSPLSGVSVEAVSDVSGDQPHMISTEADGKFQLTGLQSGTYTVTLTFPEYRTVKRDGIYLAPGMNTAMVVSLQPNKTRN